MYWNFLCLVSYGGSSKAWPGVFCGFLRIIGILVERIIGSIANEVVRLGVSVVVVLAIVVLRFRVSS